MNQENHGEIRKVLRIGFVILTVGLFALGFLAVVFQPESDVPFEKWYGDWPTAFMATALILFFVFFLTRPRRPGEWRGAGLATAFFISLFTEMFGIPLTIYVLAPLLGVEPNIFGMYESHLWAYLLSQSGVMSLKAGVYLVMVVSTGLIFLGFTLLAAGWKKVYRGQGEFVMDGLYARLRHPQYLGLILIVLAFLIMWPTLLTVLLAPFLIGRYFLLAREEDRDLEEKFGEDFRRYKETVPGFVPLLGLSGRPCRS